MPELPDLHVFSLNLQKQLAGKKLNRIALSAKAKSNATARKFKQELENEKLKTVYREGKELRLQFGNGNIVGLHMMLHGELKWFDKDAPKHTLAEFYFDKSKNVALTDFQRKATITLNPEISAVPDALSSSANISFWRKALKSRSAIKKVLLDQHVIRGIGNAYADEILWDARISPFVPANSLPDEKISTLVKSIRKVLKNAIKQVQKKAPDIIGGEVRDFLLIHNASKKLSPTGSPILVSTAGGRKTYYTNEQEGSTEKP